MCQGMLPDLKVWILKHPNGSVGAAQSTYIKVRCEGDRTMPLYSDAADGDSTSANFRSKDLVLIVIHSDAVAVIKVRDKKEGTAFYGQVQIYHSPLSPLMSGHNQQLAGSDVWKC